MKTVTFRDDLAANGGSHILSSIAGRIDSGPYQLRSDDLASVILNSISDAVSIIDIRNRKILWGNRAFLQGFGLKGDELAGKTCYEVTHHLTSPCAPPKHICPLTDIGTRGIHSVYEHVHFGKSGEKIYVEVSTSPVRDADGTITKVVHVSRNITERKQVEEELVKSRDIFKTVADFATDWTYWISPARGMLYMAPACEEITGYRPEEFFVNPGLLADIVHPDDRGSWLGHSHTTREDGRPSPTEYRIITRHKKVRWIRHICRPVYDESGTFRGLRGGNIDITSLKEAEEKYLRLAAAVESAAEAVVITDVKGAIEYVNPAFERITGYGREEAMGRNMNIIKSGTHDREFYLEMWEKLRQEEVWCGQIINRKKDGSFYVEDTTISPIRDSAGEIRNYVALKRDVIEKLRLESIAQSVNTMNNIGYVFTGIRHEIGNPINSIKMTMSVLRDNLNIFPPETVGAYVERTLGEINRVEELLKSLKNFNMYETFKPRNTQMALFMNKFTSLVRDDFEMKGISIKTIIHEGPLWGWVDPRALQQVLLNILTNAVDALEGRKAAEIVINIFRASDKIILKVADNGCGMSEDEQKNIFKPFYTTKAHGTGLGLVIVKKMLSRMNCTMQIASAKGIGTVVDIFIPEGKSDHP